MPEGPFQLSPCDYFERLIFTSLGNRRFTQSSPILPDVWLAYAEDPCAPCDLLLTPHWDAGPGKLAVGLKARLKAEQRKRKLPALALARREKEQKGTRPAPARIAYNRSHVVACLHFDELIRVALPLSAWWQNELVALGLGEDKETARIKLFKLLSEEPGAMRDKLVEALAGGAAYQPLHQGLNPDLLWMVRATGTMALLAQDEEPATRINHLQEVESSGDEKAWRQALGEIVDALFALTANLLDTSDLRQPLLWNLNRNRRCTHTVHHSCLATKADAARRVFEITGRGQKWAILDTGIDAEHWAFRRRDRAGKAAPEAFEEIKPKRRGAAVRHENHTRIVRTLDFTWVRDLLSDGPDAIPHLDLPADLRERIAAQAAGSEDALRRLLEKGRMLDWEVVEKVLEIPHEEGDLYQPPRHKHGTHVAGILGADWRSDDAPSDSFAVKRGEEETVCQGVCPEIELYDLRVLHADGSGDEFSVTSALQWVRHMNQRTEAVVVHGVNMSLALSHDMANFACGRTPVCEEVERLVGSGVVVAAAAGNFGKTERFTKQGPWRDEYLGISIADPGNAESAITVGATHKREPHTYGVSYFSSRGPTGDGRRKPDLVAPGEKIWSTTPGNEAEEMDGTSQAAPHVAGAAALLMQRSPELIGRPAEIKRILMETATDLGREPYFQGAGMLDILRALQSY